MPVVATDNFDRALLGSDWVQVDASGSVSIQSNKLLGLNGFNACWNAHPFEADQYSKLGYAEPTDLASCGVGVRISPGTSGTVNGYFYGCTYDFEWGDTSGVYKLVNGVYTSLGSSGVGFSTPIIKVVGQNIETFDGPNRRITTKTDAALVTGKSGLVDSGVPLDNWEGGNLYEVGWHNETGTNYAVYNNNIWGWVNFDTPIPVNGTLSRVSWYGSCLASDGLKIRIGVYEKQSETFGDWLKVAETDQITYSTTQISGWHDIPITGNLTQGKSYTVVFGCKFTQGSPRLYGTMLAFGDIARQTSGYDPVNSLPNSLSGTTGNNLYRPALYAEYTPSAGGGSTPVSASGIKLFEALKAAQTPLVSALEFLRPASSGRPSIVEFLKPISRKSSD